MDIPNDFARIVANSIKNTITNNSTTISYQLKFEHGYCTDGSGNIYLRFPNFPAPSSKETGTVEIRWPLSFCLYNSRSGELSFSPFANLYILMGKQGFPNAHVWGENGKLCMHGVLIQQPIQLIQAILDVLLQKNTNETSIKLGRPCPDSTLTRKCRNDIECLLAAKVYQSRIQQHFNLSSEILHSKQYYLGYGKNRINLAQNTESLLTSFINNLNK